MSPRTEQQLAAVRQKTRRRIMEAAMALFATRGFHGTAIEQIARQAGVSKGLTYHYFRSKSAILEAIIEDGLAAINALIDSTRDIADPHQQITLLIERSFNAMAREQHFWKLLMSLLLQPDIWADFHTRFDDFFREATADFAAIFERMGVADPQAEALLIAALLDGVGLHYFMDQQHYPLDTVKNALIKRYSHSEVKRQRS